MSGQYFENNENLKHDIHEISYYYKEKTIVLFGDNGVFSKHNIDFGSNLLVKSLKLKGDETVLDVGCGYGMIGVSVAAANPLCKVTMIDINERAIELARLAIEHNKLSNANVLKSDRYENIDSQFSVILTNPPIRAGKKIVHDIILGGYEHLIDGGYLICVIQKKQGAPSAIKALEKRYDKVEIINKDKGYLIIKAQKNSK